MRIAVDWNRCESNGLCVAAAPNLFKLLDDDSLLVLNEQPDDSQRDQALSAVRACPTQAISIVDD
jgi:ferredoxin